MFLPGNIYRFSLLAFVFVILVFISCSSPVMNNDMTQTNMAASGTLRINMAASEAGRLLVPEEYYDAIDTYQVIISGTQSMGPLQVSGDVFLLEDLPLGEYTISVSALDSNQHTLAAGSKSNVIVNGDERETIDIPILPVMGGEGRINVEYDWSKSGIPPGVVNKVIAEITPIGGTSIPVKVTIRDEGVRFSGEYPSGEYVLTSSLYSNETPISTVSKTVQIFDGLDTVSRFEFGSDMYQKVPESPETLTGSQNGLSVELKWVDSSDFETGYEIFRSDNGGSYSLIATGLPANTVNWTDSPVVPGTDYSYRIVAVNDFGSSEAREFSITVESLIIPKPELQLDSYEITIGDSRNTIPLSDLLQRFENNYNSSVLEVLSVSGPDAVSASIKGEFAVIDASRIPYEREGDNINLEYTVHIAGEPLNETYTVMAEVSLTLISPAVEKITEDDLLVPLRAYIYDDRSELEQKMQLYEPPSSEEVFEKWARISNSSYFDNVEDAEKSKNRKGDDASLALSWDLKKDGDKTFLEYTKNSVYAGFVSPDGEESENYILEATVSSEDVDDDTIGLIVAFFREGDSNYVLEAARSQGSTSGENFVEPRDGWGLIVRQLSPAAENPEIGDVLWIRQLNVGGENPGGWKGARSRIRVVRDKDLVTVITTDWNDENSYVPGSEITVDLKSQPELSRFRGPCKFGYFSASQERSSFQNIVLKGGTIQDKLFYLNPRTNESEVWWYDGVLKRWILMSGTDIQGVLDYPREATNPDTGETFLIERKGVYPGHWIDWWDRWEKWDKWENKE